MFKFEYGDESKGDRIIDSQFASSTIYVSTTMGGNKTMFGVNFADGRIKGYPAGKNRRRKSKGFHVLYVRSKPDYGINKFTDHMNGTITDAATGLTWMKADSGKGMDWPDALEYAENFALAGHDDWRLPNAKELQSLVDYTRSPDSAGTAAIDPVFDATKIINEGGEKDFAHYWTSSSHVRSRGSDAAVYLAFGRSLGFMPDRQTGEKVLMDVHGAGSQRSDPKVGDASRFPKGRGPQGDVIRIQNMVRLVRGGAAVLHTEGPAVKLKNAEQHRSNREGGRFIEPSLPGTGRAPDHERMGGPEDGGGGFVQRLDRDGDGKVSKKEFHGPRQHFSKFDQNRDGYLTEDEAPTGPPSGKSPGKRGPPRR